MKVTGFAILVLVYSCFHVIVMWTITSKYSKWWFIRLHKFSKFKKYCIFQFLCWNMSQTGFPNVVIRPFRYIQVKLVVQKVQIFFLSFQISDIHRDCLPKSRAYKRDQQTSWHISNKDQFNCNPSASHNSCHSLRPWCRTPYTPAWVCPQHPTGVFNQAYLLLSHEHFWYSFQSKCVLFRWVCYYNYPFYSVSPYCFCELNMNITIYLGFHTI